MIKINLPENFLLNDDIKTIYDSFSEKIIKGCSEVEVKIQYKGDELKFNKTGIYEFLTARDFYNYNIECKCEEKITLSKLKKNLNLDCRVQFTKVKEELVKNKDNLRRYGYHIVDYYFSYERLSDIDRTKILKAMNVFVCPYCNMNYIMHFKKKNGKTAVTADLDHFYVKSKYPQYALCLFNFVPSCNACNSRLKRNQEMKVEDDNNANHGKEVYVYPHNEGFQEKASFIVRNLTEVVINTKQKAEISLEIGEYKGENIRKIQNSSTLFEINSRYEQMNSYADELIENAVIYNELYSGELEMLLGDIDIKSMVFGQSLSEDEILNQSLGKLKMDLLKQLGIFG